MSRRPSRTVILRGAMGTAGAVGALVGVHALRRAGARVLWPVSRDEYRDENFALIDDDRAGAVVADDGVRLVTRACGPVDAPVTVIFVHGFCNSMESFHFQRRDLARRWGTRARLVFFDLRGHGRSGTPSAASCTVAQLGRDVGAVIEAAAPKGPVVLVGHSLGGMAILAAAIHIPEVFAARVIGVGLLSTAAVDVAGGGVTQLLRHPAFDGFRLAVRTSATSMQACWTLAKPILEPLLHASSFHGQVSPTLSRFTTLMIEQTAIETVAKFLKAIEQHDESAALPIIAGLPVLVLGGSHDPVTPFSDSQALAMALPNGELVRLDAAHMAHLQFPDKVNDALDRLLTHAGAFGRVEFESEEAADG